MKSRPCATAPLCADPTKAADMRTVREAMRETLRAAEAEQKPGSRPEPVPMGYAVYEHAAVEKRYTEFISFLR